MKRDWFFSVWLNDRFGFTSAYFTALRDLGTAYDGCGSLGSPQFAAKVPR
jgi:hypothetical protein